MTTPVPAQVATFLNYKVTQRGISATTQESYRHCLCEFCAFLGHGKGAPQTERHDIRQYIASCYARKLKARTIGHHIATLREFFKFLQVDGVIQRNPMDGIELPKIEKRLPRFFSETEIRQFLDAPLPTHNRGFRHALNLRDRAICEMFYAGGIRESELIAARLCDLNLVENRCLKVFGKGSKERFAPFSPDFSRHLRIIVCCCPVTAPPVALYIRRSPVH